MVNDNFLVLVGQYKCPVCGATFRSIFRLKQHFKMTHMKHRPFICPICGKKFINETCLAKHSLTCNDEKHMALAFLCYNLRTTKLSKEKRMQMINAAKRVFKIGRCKCGL